MKPAGGSDITIESLWRGLSRSDRILLLVFAVLMAASFFGGAGGIWQILRLCGYGLGFALSIRFIRRFLRQIIWRLRNRLLVAYGFIALVPIVLLMALSGLVFYAFVGQVAIYLVNVEMERRTSLLISVAQHLAEVSPDSSRTALEQMLPVLESRLPDLEVRLDNTRSWTYPSEAPLEAPPADWGDAGGIVVRDGLLYAWAHIVRPATSVTAMVPLTSRFLAGLAPNIGEISFLRLDTDFTQPSRRLRLHRYTGEAIDADTPRNRLPDPASRWDIEIRWATAVPAFLWEAPGRVENELMRIRTRPVAVLNTVFAQKVDVWQDIIPAASVVLLIAFLIAEAGSIVIGVSITRTITGAVHDLYEGTERIREGDFSHRIQVKGSDQLASLSQSFNGMTADIERLLVVAKENQRLQNDLEIAREVQAQLYPRGIPEMKTLRMTAFCNPARMVSGDYYDYQRLDEDILALAVGDVAGKGISAALLMATVQSALRTQVRHCLETRRAGNSLVSTSDLVSKLNQHLYANTTPEKYATFCFGVYDERNSLFTYTNAGHLPPMLMRDGEPTMLDVNGTVVGAFPFSRYGESQILLLPGDLLLFYTDGITEAENPYGEQFGDERLLEALRRHRHLSPDEILPKVVELVSEWTASPELQDDMTLLLARRV
jgi:sigma-B regulation protein RsbU (phosphoserine phosphatase)